MKLKLSVKKKLEKCCSKLNKTVLLFNHSQNMMLKDNFIVSYKYHMANLVLEGQVWHLLAPNGSNHHVSYFDVTKIKVTW